MAKKEIKITETDLKIIFGLDYAFFKEKVIPNCFCYTCKIQDGNSGIVDYEIFLNDLNDVILRGFCTGCNGKVARYLETGEMKKCIRGIRKVRKLHEKQSKKIQRKGREIN